MCSGGRADDAAASSRPPQNKRARIGGAFFFEPPPLDNGTKDAAFAFIVAVLAWLACGCFWVSLCLLLLS